MSKSNLCKKRLWRSCWMGREKRRKIIISKVYETFLCSHNDFLHFLVFCAISSSMERLFPLSLSLCLWPLAGSRENDDDEKIGEKTCINPSIF
jgi:hypothetical protein